MSRKISCKHVIQQFNYDQDASLTLWTSFYCQNHCLNLKFLQFWRPSDGPTEWRANVDGSTKLDSLDASLHLHGRVRLLVSRSVSRSVGPSVVRSYFPKNHENWPFSSNKVLADVKQSISYHQAIVNWYMSTHCWPWGLRTFFAPLPTHRAST